MIEAIIVCIALDNSMRSCSTWRFKEPKERTPANVEEVLVECASIVEEMAKEGFTVTCEEAIEE